MTLSGIDRIHKLRRQLTKHGKPPAKAPAYGGSLWNTYGRIYPRYLEPHHLLPVFDLFERAKRGERVRATVSLPPRAGKTETLIGGVVDRLLFNSQTRVGYASYSARLAEKKSYRARGLALQHGVPIDPTSRSKKDWRTGVEEGGLWATSVGGSIVGEGFELLLPDDLISGRLDAERQQVRDDTHSWLISDCLSRMEPEGSIILCGTRYHVDDPIGRCINAGWEHIVIPAIGVDDEGQEFSYWPERWTLERLQELRMELGGPDGYEWRSLYMGDPLAPDDMVFRDAHLCSEVIGSPRIGIGVDFAYTTNKSSDYSVAVVLAEAAGIYYVIDVIRRKVPEAVFREEVRKLAERWEAQYVVGYIAHTEQPNIDLLAQEMPAFGRTAVADKKVRALPTAAGWNLGRIKVMADQHWTKDFVAEVVGFTGNDRHDDQVDALVAVYDSMYVGGSVDWKYMDELQAAAPAALDWAVS